MKKLIAIAVVLALVAGVAFAQTANGISVNAWGRAAFSPLKNISEPRNSDGNVEKGEDGKDKKGESFSGVGASWGGGTPRIDFRINGSSDFVGFNTQFSAENAIGVEDNLHIWLKPFGSDILKLTAGKIADDTLRGKIGNLDGGFSNFVLGIVDEEDSIFNRFSTWSGVNSNSPYGWMISSAPVDGLYIGLVVSGALNDWGSPWNATTLDQAYRYLQLGAGYNIANVGHIRAQYIGGWGGDIDTKDEDLMANFIKEGGKPARLELAFALTAVEGLLIDFGAKIGIAQQLVYGSDKLGSSSSGIGVSVGATFNSGDFGLGARIDAAGFGAYDRANEDDKSEGGGAVCVRVVPTFALGEASLGLDVAFALGMESKNAAGDAKKDNWSQVGFGAFVKKGVGPGHIMAGLSYTAPRSWSNGDVAKGQFESGVFQLPIILEYYFF